MRIKFICAAIALSIVSTGASAGVPSGTQIAQYANIPLRNIQPAYDNNTINMYTTMPGEKTSDPHAWPPTHPDPELSPPNFHMTIPEEVTSDPQAGINTLPDPALPPLEVFGPGLSPISGSPKGDTKNQTPGAEPYKSAQKFEEAAKKKAAESYYREKSDKANAAKKQAAIDNARRFLSILTAEEAAAKIKAANGEEKNKGREEQALIDDAFSVFDITAEEAAAKIKAAEDEAVKQTTKKDSSYILTNESLKATLGPLMDMFGPLLKKYPQLANIIANFKNIKIEKLTDVTEYKIITMGGIVKTIHCNPCTWHSATLQGLRIGRDMGMPLDIFNAIYDEFGGESIIKKSDMRILIISIWKNLENVMAKAMADPNFDIANAMTKKQIQQIQLQAGSIDNSGGSAGGNDHHHDEGHHEEAM